MIDVKGIRSNKPETDPADPLGLRATPEPATRVLSSWAVGLISFGLYIRSFLWHDTAPVPAAQTDNAPPAPDRNPVVDHMAAAEPDDPETAHPDEGEDQSLAVSYYQLPGVVGTGGSITFAPPPLMPVEPLSANSSLPPFASATGRVPVIEGPPADGSFGGASISTVADQVQYAADGAPVTASDPTVAPAKPSAEVIRPDFGNAAPPPSPVGPPSQGTDGAEPPADRDTEPPVEEPDVDATPGRDTPPRNREPRHAGPVVLGDVGSGTALAISLSHFLSQTQDPDGDPLQITMGHPTSGALTRTDDGWQYIADTDDLGAVQIAYVVSDGEFEVVQTAILNVVENAFTGTDGDDLIVGTQGRDVITGWAGDDNLAGLGGRDRIFGGDGDDNIAGGDGDDALYGGGGADVIAGGGGSDLIYGGAGDDKLYGDDGDDHLYGEAGADVIEGGAGDDRLDGGSGDDRLAGGIGADEVTGGTGHDAMFGGAGNDRLSGDAGDDALHGGDGADLLSGGAGTDRIVGENGEDMIYGGTGHDVIHGGADADILFGGADNDVVSGEAGHDLLFGDAGADTVSGGDGDDLLSGGADADIVQGGAGNDTVLADNDQADDHFDGGAGEDVLTYAAATDGVTIDLAQSIVTGLSTGTDSIANFETFVGTRQDDTFHAGDGDAVMTGNGGSDLYDFVQGDTVDLARSIYEITDFGDDDRIWISRGDTHQEIRRAQRSLEDRIENGIEDYAVEVGADEPRLVFHHDWTESYRRTIITVDFDRDDTVDLDIYLTGEHVLLVEHA